MTLRYDSDLKLDEYIGAPKNTTKVTLLSLLISLFIGLAIKRATMPRE